MCVLNTLYSEEETVEKNVRTYNLANLAEKETYEIRFSLQPKSFLRCVWPEEGSRQKSRRQ